MTTSVNLVILPLMVYIYISKNSPSDPLWDGKDCSSEGDRCTAPGLPWFHNVLNTTTTDYLELRGVCGDEGTADEDTPVSFYELYIK